MQPTSPNFVVPVEKEGSRQLLSLTEFETLTGASFIPHLAFSPLTEKSIRKRCAKTQKKGLLSREQLWLGTYYRQELLFPPFPDIFLRWIDPEMGWGVFANRNLRKMEFIAEYSGVVRRRKRRDWKNSYCFEYLISPEKKTRFTIDAREQGGISRYINHSSTPNLTAALATCDGICHVILFTKEPIAQGTELTYDYGPDYWSHRPPPRVSQE